MTEGTSRALLAIKSLNDETRAQIEADRDVFRFKMLPFIAVRRSHPWATDLPTGLRNTHITRTSYALTWSINRSLLEASHLARTWAPNGNRWVLGVDEPPQYIAMRSDRPNELQTLPLLEDIRIAHPAAIALSLQLRQGSKVTDDHVLSITTRVAARSLPILVAAGNWGAFGAGTLSPLARFP